MGQPGYASLRRLFSTAMTLLGAGFVLTLSLLVWTTFFGSRPGMVYKPESHYDFIIVGAGTAGCVLAARLSDDPNRSVLLLEAGPEFGWLASVPLAAPLVQNTVNDWAFRTESQPLALWGLRNQSSAWPRGKGLGGSGQLNYMVHFPGLRSDFRRWEDEGAHGWGFAQMRPVLERLTCERRQDKRRHRCPRRSYKQAMRGRPNECYIWSTQCQPTLHLSSAVDNTMARVFQKAGVELGAPSESDEYAEHAFRGVRSSMNAGRRWSSLESHLRPALGRPNLHVMLNTQVARVLFSADLGPGSPRRAVGVQLTSGAVVLTRREVVMSAGAISSPQLLMLSGVGPHSHLQGMGIPLVADLPVGRNLHDHLNMPLFVSFTRPVSLTLSKLRSIRQVARYLLYGEGYLSTTAITGVATVPPNLGLMLFGMGTPEESVLGQIANYLPETFRALFPLASNASQEGAVLLSSCLQPRSRGSVTLHDTSPFSAPRIDPHYLADQSDITCMTKALRLAGRVVSTKAFKRLGARLHLPDFPRCGVPDLMDDEYVECIIRTAAITGYHPAGTCRMGGVRHNSAVVDPELRVRGVSGLRVIDASVFPSPVSGTPNSVLLAVADRMANRLIIEHPASTPTPEPKDG